MNTKLSARKIAAYFTLLCFLGLSTQSLLAGDDAVTTKVKNGTASTASGEQVPAYPGVKEISSDTMGYVAYSVPVPRKSGETEVTAQMQKIAEFCEAQYLKSGRFSASETKYQRMLIAHERINGTMFVWNIAVPLKDGKMNLPEIRKNGISFWKVQDYEKKYKD